MSKFLWTAALLVFPLSFLWIAYGVTGVPTLPRWITSVALAVLIIGLAWSNRSKLTKR